VWTNEYKFIPIDNAKITRTFPDGEYVVVAKDIYGTTYSAILDKDIEGRPLEGISSYKFNLGPYDPLREVDLLESECLFSITSIRDGKLYPTINPRTGLRGTIFSFAFSVDSTGIEYMPASSDSAGIESVFVSTVSSGFSYRVNTVEREVERAYFVLSDLGGNELLVADMYDDGLHGDGENGDYMFGAIFDSSSLPVGLYKLRFYVIDNFGMDNSRDFSLKIEDESAFQSNCIEVYRGHNRVEAHNRANAIFIGYGYDSITDVAEISRWQMDKLLELTPFNENRNKINFWVVNEIGSLDLCHDVDYIFYESVDCISDLKQRCPFSNAFVNHLVNRDFRSHAYPAVEETHNSFPLERLGRDYLLAHEFGGHTFGKLLDEYVEPDNPDNVLNSLFHDIPYVLPQYGPNCYSTIEDTTYDQCWQNAPWKEFFGRGCGDEGVIDCENLVLERQRCILACIDLYEDLNERTSCVDSCPVYPEGAEREITCVEGCQLFEHGTFRPNHCSLMMAPEFCLYFGLWNEHLLQQKLNQYSE